MVQRFFLAFSTYDFQTRSTQSSSVRFSYGTFEPLWGFRSAGTPGRTGPAAFFPAAGPEDASGGSSAELESSTQQPVQSACCGFVAL